MKKNIPAEALRFRASIDVKPDSRKFQGVAYSGKALSHWLWDQLAIDLETLQAAEKIPALVEHDRSQRAGVASLSVEQNQLMARGTLLSNPHGQQVAQDADEGFPWQMSVHVEPGSVERFDAGAEVEVNGQKLAGPLHVFRHAAIREVSFTPTGVDNRTRANVFSAQELSIEIEDFSMPDPKSNDTEAKLAALQAQLNSLQSSLDAEKAARRKAEQALIEAKRARQESAINRLAEQTGKQFSAEDREAMLNMDEAAFQLMAKHLETARPALPEQLFSMDGNPQGPGKTEDNLLLIDCEQRYGGQP
jgi:hypothetical protein